MGLEGAVDVDHAAQQRQQLRHHPVRVRVRVRVRVKVRIALLHC